VKDLGGIALRVVLPILVVGALLWFATTALAFPADPCQPDRTGEISYCGYPSHIWAAEAMANGDEVSHKALLQHLAAIGWLSTADAVSRWVAWETRSSPAFVLAVSWCESRHEPAARGDWGWPDRGYHALWDGRLDYWAEGQFQIRWDVHHATVRALGYERHDLHDPWINAAVALEVWRLAGNSWRPWSCA
jgi:hypothetical protein